MAVLDEGKPAMEPADNNYIIDNDDKKSDEEDKKSQEEDEDQKFE